MRVGEGKVGGVGGGGVGEGVGGKLEEVCGVGVDEGGRFEWSGGGDSV